MTEFIYQISLNWFLLYYISLGLILTVQGFLWLLRPAPFADYLKVHAENQEEPKLVLKALRYVFLFTVLSFLLAFFPFSWTELIFSIWSFLIIYILGSFFLKWNVLSKIILENHENVLLQIKKGGAMMLSLGVVMFLLAYVLLTSVR